MQMPLAFDYCCMWTVLEHIQNALQMFKHKYF